MEEGKRLAGVKRDKRERWRVKMGSFVSCKTYILGHFIPLLWILLLWVFGWLYRCVVFFCCAVLRFQKRTNA